MRQYQLLPEEVDESSAERIDALLSSLNETQRQAASTTDGPVLVVAGPGSGKTRVLTHRVAYLIAAGRARPYEILALTFTNKSAREMKARIESLVGADRARGIWMGTFHSIFARVLRVEGEHVGYTSDFSIYDADDQDRVLRGLMHDYGIDTRQFSVRMLRSFISGAKNQMVSPGQYAQVASTLQQQQAAKIYQPYQDLLRRSNALDFDDLLLKPIELFKSNAEILAKYRSRWRYIHIDEYQDTNHAQYQLARMLAEDHKNICVVGDDAQSIYAFRGADIGNILSFQRDYPNAASIRLEQNYRSTKKIIRLADSVIKHNRDQLEKSLWTDNVDGEDVVLIEALSERDEAQKIEQQIRDASVRVGYQYREFAVLYRTNSQSRAIEDALRRGGIAYRVVGGVSFYQRREIKDVLAYLRLVVNPRDVASLRRVINYPRRAIGDTTQKRIEEYASVHGLSFWEGLVACAEAGVSKRAQSAINQFVAMINGFAELAETEPADLIARDVIHASGILEELRREHTTENLVRWENVQELVNAIAEFVENNPDSGSLSTFLQEVSLLTDADEDKGGNRVTLMTLHSSKGLEFPVVFITGLEEGLFPLASAAQDRADLEEERRLFYVGITRAEQRLFLTTARTRYRFGEQQACIRSRFIDEADDAVICTESGGRFASRGGRFTRDSDSFVSYEGLDPEYYRVSLRGSDNRKRGAHRRQIGAEGTPKEHHVVYEEGVGELVPGVRVEHPMFGVGQITRIEGTGAQQKATVEFDEVGQKKLVLRFARLQIIQ